MTSKAQNSNSIDTEGEIWYKRTWAKRMVVGFVALLLTGVLSWAGATLLQVSPVQSNTKDNTKDLKQVEEQVQEVDQKVDEEVIPTLERIDERTKQMDKRIE